jgi:UDP-N-acetyl-D-galactosamine dehydrogenase
MILAVAHEQFKQMPIAEIRALGKSQAIIYDLKYLFPADQTDARL